MKIVRVKKRYFLAEVEQDLHDIALKVLNEYRVVGDLEPKALEFVEKACDSIDGELAWALLTRIEKVEILTPEMNR